MDAARKYKMGEKASWLVKLHWTQYVSLDPFGAYLLACSHGWTTQAKDAAQSLLGGTIQEIEVSYSPSMEDMSTQHYHRLLTYHARCSTAIFSAGSATTTWLDVKARKMMLCRHSVYYDMDNVAGWVAPAITRAVVILLPRPSPRTIKEAIASAVLVTLIQETKCGSCSFPSAYATFGDSIARKVQQLIDAVRGSLYQFGTVLTVYS
ncbi:uncharacterized protein B0H18DRAFT_994601 [Fomitopsis serialis]|uniref:uncharacterized protein n=1 Tax=Fomitopsis serialis TaxID=139415 RepID=UPI002008629A|nr:uncharacterized protein B0H18DRAFT_994601 [Neoantrodia serialis]KAH9930361.1 hypothetical protein B0H18DRAFT_994601 [Neoantrodia serialis]